MNNIIIPKVKILRAIETRDVAFTFAMPSGIPGDVSRAEHATIEAQLLDTVNFPLSYGVPVKIVSGKVAGITTGDTTSTHIHGWYVRPFPTNSGQDALNVQTIPTSGIVNILVRGYIMVFVQFNAASAAKDSPVYVRTATAFHTKPLGGVEGGSDSTDTYVLPLSYFTGTADAQGICEVAFNI
jgi:hypothetical protein